MLSGMASVASALSGSGFGGVRTAVRSLTQSRRSMVKLGAAAFAVFLIAVWLVWSYHQPGVSAEALRWYQIGVAGLRDGTYYRAAKALEEAVKLDPGFALAHARLAEARSELDDAEGAAREMLAALPTRFSRSA